MVASGVSSPSRVRASAQVRTLRRENPCGRANASSLRAPGANRAHYRCQLYPWPLPQTLPARNNDHAGFHQPREIVHDVDAQLVQTVGLTNSGKLQ